MIFWSCSWHGCAESSGFVDDEDEVAIAVGKIGVVYWAFGSNSTGKLAEVGSVKSRHLSLKC